MNPVRLLVSAALVLVTLALAALAVVFNGRFQTWRVRQVLAEQKVVTATVGAVEAGWQRLNLNDLRVEHAGMRLTIPTLHAELPILAARFHHRLELRRLVAKGWTLDLRPKLAATTASPPGGPSFSIATPALSSSPAPALASPDALTVEAFKGVFNQLRLPVDLRLDEVDLAGEVILPDERGRVQVVITGGELRAQHEGKFEVQATLGLIDPIRMAGGRLRATFTVGMDTPRTLTRLEAKVHATAAGSQFPQGVSLDGSLSAARSAHGESYEVVAVADGKELLMVRASFSQAGQTLEGKWRVNVQEGDVAPFTMDYVLPAFTAVGEGKFSADVHFAQAEASGQLEMTADRLGVIRPELGGWGALRMTAAFDAARKGRRLVVRRFDAELWGHQPLGTVRALQPFEFDFQHVALQASDPARDLFGITLDDVPASWVQPWIKDYTISAGTLHGNFVARTKNAGFSVRARTPFAIRDVSVGQGGRALVRGVHVLLEGSGDYTAEGWQADIEAFSAKSGSATLLTCEAKFGQLTEQGQPIKATGQLVADLPALLAQPWAQNRWLLTRGDLAMTFVGSMGSKQELQANLAVTHLELDPKNRGEQLPGLSGELRLDLEPGGKMSWHAPVVIEREGRKSDLMLVGNLSPDQTERRLEAHVSSTFVVVDDVRALLALTPAGNEKPSSGSLSPVRRSAWTGLNGQVTLALKHVVHSQAFQSHDVTGTVQLTSGSLQFENVRAKMGGEGEIRLGAAVVFDQTATPPYQLQGDLLVTDWDPSPWFQAASGTQPAAVEGKFNVSSKLGGEADRVAALTFPPRSEFHFTSRSGLFRGLPVSVAAKVENVSKFAASMAALSNLAAAFGGGNGKPMAEVASRAEAITELAGMLAAIPYDQLNVVLVRDAALNTTLKAFTLISPEMRLSGSGVVTHQPGRPLLEAPMEMEFKLRVRGHTADLMKYLGVLEPELDDLGYGACTLPLKIFGTLGQPDATELSRALTSLAMEKSGVGDRASELFNKLLGK